MPKLIDARDDAMLVLVGGTICTGKDTAAEAAVEIMKARGYGSESVSMTECVRIAGNLSKDDPREKYRAFFRGKENSPWLAKAISGAYHITPGNIIVISGLRRKCDAEYFRNTFQGAYFVSLIADENTLVARIAARNQPMDFPPGTPEEQKPMIAAQLLREEEKAYGIMAMLGYVSREVPRARTYLIDTSKQQDTKDLEANVERALNHFSLI